MAFLLQLSGTVMGFVVVMAATSMLVTALVRVVHYLAGTRGRTVMEMLAAINQGFRAHFGDRALPGDAAETAFVLDILGDPAVHSQSGIQSFWSPVVARPDRSLALEQRRDQLARRVEHIRKEDLLQVIERHVSNERLPATWQCDIGDKATFAALSNYITQWFNTAEGLATERFRKDTRCLVAVLSSLLVVLLNLDGLQLISTLHHDVNLQNTLASWAPDLLQTSERLRDPNPRPVDREQLISGVSADVEQLNGILNEPGLLFGWQRSWIIQRWCAEDAGCASAAGLARETPPAWGWRVLRWLRWVAGLGFSLFMLSLGAQFWADRLRDVLNARNALASKPASK